MSKVTTLEPRTPHQPGKLQKLSKNEVVVLLLFSESIKLIELYVLWVQSSAGHPQAGELNSVQACGNPRLQAAGDNEFWRVAGLWVARIGCDYDLVNCENRGKNLAGSGICSIRHTEAFAGSQVLPP